MFRKINFKILTTIFVVLLIVVVFIEIIDSRKGNRTFKSDLVEVVADEVTSIELYPKVTDGNLIKLFKENEEWKVESEGSKYNADQSSANRMIAELNTMKPKSVAASNKDRWEQFEVTDSLGTRVKLFKGTDLLANVIIGKFSFSQPRNMTSYVRLNGEKEVYGVDGMLGMSFNRNLDAFRDQTVINSNKTDWKRLSFIYPADSSFVLERMGDQWMTDGIKADSASVVQYFNKISNLTESNFAKNKPAIPSTHRLIIEGNNMMQKIEIAGYLLDEGNFILETNQNPGTYFNSKTSAETLFISSSTLTQK